MTDLEKLVVDLTYLNNCGIDVLKLPSVTKGNILAKDLPKYIKSCINFINRDKENE
jgi:hypothetical protein